MGKGGRTRTRSTSSAKSASFADLSGGLDDVGGNDNDDDADYNDNLNSGGGGGDDYFDDGYPNLHNQHHSSDTNQTASKRRRRENADLFWQAVTEHRKRSPQELATLFEQYCGAISVKNGKLCANMRGRCSVHNDEDRRVAREKILSTEDPLSSSPEPIDPQLRQFQLQQQQLLQQQLEQQQPVFASPRPAPPPAFFPSFTATTNVVLPKAILGSPLMQAYHQQQTPPRNTGTGGSGQ